MIFWGEEGGLCDGGGGFDGVEIFAGVKESRVLEEEWKLWGGPRGFYMCPDMDAHSHYYELPGVGPRYGQIQVTSSQD